MNLLVCVIFFYSFVDVVVVVAGLFIHSVHLYGSLIPLHTTQNTQRGYFTTVCIGIENSFFVEWRYNTLLLCVSHKQRAVDMYSRIYLVVHIVSYTYRALSTPMIIMRTCVLRIWLSIRYLFFISFIFVRAPEYLYCTMYNM